KLAIHADTAPWPAAPAPPRSVAPAPPRSVAPAPPRSVAPAPPRSVAPAPPGLAIATASPPPAPAVPPAPRAAPIDDRDRLGDARRAILVIEDDLAFAKILADLAREHEFHTLI